MTTKFSNNAVSKLASGVAIGATSMTVTATEGNKFPVVVPPDVAYVTIENATYTEIIKITARALGSDAMTIVKAQEGTTDRAWLTGDTVSLRLTAAQAELGANAQDVAAAALAAHAVAADPHPIYTTAAEMAAALAAYQPHDAQLDTLATVTAQQATDLASLSAFIGTLLNDTDAPTARATLGIINSATTRHAVLGGPVDASGYPAPGGSTGGTSITTTSISAIAPFVVGFANGFGASGEVNYFGISTANLSWSGLSTNGTMYLYVDYNAGALSTGATTLAPVYQNGGTYSTAADQATFNIAEMVMKVGDGSVANQMNRVFVGEVTVAGGVVTAITWYAYRGEYVSSDTAIPATGTVTAFSHNLGVTRAQISGELVCQTSELGYAAGENIDAKAYYNSGTYAIAMPTATLINGKSGSITTGYSGGGFIVVDKLSSPGSTAPITAAKWKMRFRAKRGW